MGTYRAEPNADLLFCFPNDLKWEELDKQGVRLPFFMKFVDLVIDRDKDILLVEIKDPSHSKSTNETRDKYLLSLKDKSIISKNLTPKARDSYLFLHLMDRDKKPFKYIVLLGLDIFDQKQQTAILTPFKDRLMRYIRREAYKPWKRKYIEDCMIFSVDTWNEYFPTWKVIRKPTTK